MTGPHGSIRLIEPACTSCMICARECPTWCIHIDSHTEPIPDLPPGVRERTQHVLDRFAIDWSLCMYCGICIEECPFDALAWVTSPTRPAAGDRSGRGDGRSATPHATPRGLGRLRARPTSREVTPTRAECAIQGVIHSYPQVPKVFLAEPNAPGLGCWAWTTSCSLARCGRRASTVTTSPHCAGRTSSYEFAAVRTRASR